MALICDKLMNYLLTASINKLLMFFLLMLWDGFTKFRLAAE